jgi:hypothetical protein
VVVIAFTIADAYNVIRTADCGNMRIDVINSKALLLWKLIYWILLANEK